MGDPRPRLPYTSPTLLLASLLPVCLCDVVHSRERGWKILAQDHLFLRQHFLVHLCCLCHFSLLSVCLCEVVHARERGWVTLAQDCLILRQHFFLHPCYLYVSAMLFIHGSVDGRSSPKITFFFANTSSCIFAASVIFPCCLYVS